MNIIDLAIYVALATIIFRVTNGLINWFIGMLSILSDAIGKLVIKIFGITRKRFDA